MGVKYAWQLLRDKKLVPDSQDKVSLVSTASKIRVDVCSTHYTSIRHYYSNPTDLNVAHGKLERLLLKIDDKNKLRFYIDGLPAAEKDQTHANRHQSRQKDLIKASTAISNLESRLVEGKRIRKHHITSANKPLRQAFHWSLEGRMSFVEYMANKDYDIVLCPTESDVLIAAECQPDDAVISCDSDLLFYKTVPVVWRPIGSYKSRRFVPFEKNAVLEALGLSSTQLTTLAIVSGNDYVTNIPHLAITSNLKKLNSLHGDEMSIIRQYLADTQVKRRTDQEGDKWSEESYADAIKVFVRMQQSISSDSSPPSSAASNDSVAPEDPTKVTSEDSAQDASLSYSFLRERMDRFMNAFDVFKTNAYEARVAKRVASDAQSEPEAETKIMNPFATIDKQNPANAHQYRPRFSPKVRFEPSKEQSAPPISMQYILKPWKEPPEKPSLPEPSKKKPAAAIKNEISEDNRFGRKEMMNALCFEHPIVTLDLDRLSSNVHAAVENDPLSKVILECIRGAVRVACDSKRHCQMLIGLYLEDLFYPSPTPGVPRPAVPVAVISQQDQSILDNLCPRLSSNEMNDDSNNVSSAGDGQDDGSNTPFIHSLLTFLYSGNLPTKGKTGSAVNAFIGRLQEMGHLEKSQVAKADMIKSVKEYTPGFVARSVASQMSAELKRHYRHGTKMVSEKVQTMIKKKKLASDKAVDLTAKKPAIQLFVEANATAGRPWRLSPLSPEEDGYMTFTEIELAAFLHKRDELHPILKKLIGCKDKRRLAQEDVTRDWLSFQTPGVLIQRLIAPVDPRTPDGDRMRGRQKKKAGIAAAVRVIEPEELRAHINTLRGDVFDPRTYQEKGYFLCGSIKTDGYQLQLLAYKVRELNSVKFKRYKNDVLPDRLLTTTAGTSDFLTEVRNVFKTTADVERLLGCTPDETDKVSYLCIDLGQAFVAGAYALLPQDKTPKIGKRRRHRKRKKRGSRGRRNRGSGKGKKENVCRVQGERHINLAAKQKAVARPTLRHRSWMDKHKMADLKMTSSPSTTNTESAAPPTISQPSTSSTEAATTESLSIRTIESSLPPLRGANASFVDHIACRKANKSHLDTFYNGKKFRHKKYKRMSKKARQREFEHLTDSLLRMVGGSIGEKKKEDAKVVIGIGMGRFTSTSRLSSLHGTFESYFIQKARSLGYLVVGVHEFYTSKKCPTCGNFVGQAESIRRLYCYHCKKYMHRDVMAGHNIVNIVRSHVEQQERPLYLHPVDKDGHYPWLEHGCETAAQPRDAPSSLKQASSSGGRAGRAGRKRRAEADGNAERGRKRTKATMAKGKGKATTTKDKANAMQVDS